MPKFSAKGACLFAAFCTLLFSCRKNDIDVGNITTDENLTPRFALPIGFVDLSLDQIEQEFDEGFIFNDGQQVFEVILESDVFDISPSDYLDLPDQSIEEMVAVPADVVVGLNAGNAGDQVDFAYDFEQNFQVDGSAEIDSVIMAAGQLAVEVSTDVPHDIVLSFELPYVKKEGQTLAFTVNVPTTGGATTVSYAEDLAGYTFDLTSEGTTINTISYQSNIQLTHSGATMDGSEEVSIQLSFNPSDFESVWGYFGQQTFNNSTGTELVSFFSETDGGSIGLADPRLELDIFNTTGIASASSFVAIYESGNTTVLLDGAGLEIPPIPAASFVGDTTVVEHTIDNSNTSPTLTELLDDSPELIQFEFESQLNPAGFTQNFITNQSRVWAEADLILPLFGYADNFSYIDSLEFSVEDELEISPENNVTVDDVESATLRIVTENGLPIDATIQCYFADSLGTVVDSLFKLNTGVGANLLVGGILDGNGIVTAPTSQTTDVTVTTEQLQLWKDEEVSQIIVRATTETSPDGTTNVQFLPDYRIRVELGAKVDFNINLSE